jgi:hypothetical protein
VKSVIEFLKNFPNKWLLFLLFVIVFASYLWLRHDFLAQVSRDLIVAILTITGVRQRGAVGENVREQNVNIGDFSAENKEQDEKN